MAFFDPAFTPSRPGLRSRLTALFETPFDRRSRQIAAEVAELRRRSDEELAQMGIRRDQILMHVFGARR
ncbi:hypothetical protein [Thalassococcus lentus]|uniref:DUF1127 domain-containing protein n=1 Tax=Thalassococcus lentus TaxID=1210524 RepID=A0ABT4XVD9_9RHOB|nr:hypothetical protein [Thalassococcus lentus]MDA7425924.1 hypothetical protein [Thalassococcus lentus]